MKLMLTFFCIPVLFISCLFPSLTEEEDAGDETAEETEEENSDDEEDEASEGSSEPADEAEITPVDVTSDTFIGSFFSGSYTYRNVSLYSSYDTMTNELGEPEESGEIVDGTYYNYGPIAFNFPQAADEDTNTGELQVDGIIIFPEEFYKMDAVESYGWPSFDEPGNFRMFYDADSDDGMYAMLTYDTEDRITAIVLHNMNLDDTDFYESE